MCFCAAGPVLFPQTLWLVVMLTRPITVGHNSAPTRVHPPIQNGVYNPHGCSLEVGFVWH